MSCVPSIGFLEKDILYPSGLERTSDSRTTGCTGLSSCHIGLRQLLYWSGVCVRILDCRVRAQTPRVRDSRTGTRVFAVTSNELYVKHRGGEMKCQLYCTKGGSQSNFCICLEFCARSAPISLIYSKLFHVCHRCFPAHVSPMTVLDAGLISLLSVPSSSFGADC